MVGVLLGLGALPAAARAQVWTGEAAPGSAQRLNDAREALGDWIEAGSQGPPTSGATTGSAASRCVDVCSDLWLSEHRPIPNQPLSSQIWRELNKDISVSRIRAGVMKIPTVMGKGTVLGLGVTALSWVGPGIVTKLFGTETPQEIADQSTGGNWNIQVTQWRVVEANEKLTCAGTSCNFAPAFGLAATLSQHSTTHATPPCSGNATQPPIMPQLHSFFSNGDPVAGGDMLLTTAAQNFVCPNGTTRVTTTYVWDVWAPWVPVPPTWPGQSPLLAPTTAPQTINTQSSPRPQVQPAPTRTQVMQEVDQIIASPDTITHVWIDSVIGTSPDPVVGPEPEPEPTPGSGTPGKTDVSGPNHPGPDSIPPINFGPISNAGSGCDVFPFGVPCYVVGAVGGFGGNGHCPTPTFPLPDIAGEDLQVDFCTAQPMVNVVRPMLGLAAIVALVVGFMSFASGRGGGGGD